MTDSADSKIRSGLARACRRAFAAGIQTGNGGNASARGAEPGSMLVTATGGSFFECDEQSFLATDLDGSVQVGDMRPTREAFMHGQIYKDRQDVNAIVHAHSVYAIWAAHIWDHVPLVTLHSRLKIGSGIPVAAVPSPFVRPEDWPKVAAVLAEDADLKAFILRDHGVVAMAKTPMEAEETAELIEETCKIACLEAIGDVQDLKLGDS